MTPDYVDCGAAVAPFGDEMAGRSQVAFGAIAAPGVTPAFSVTGAGSVLVWGGWSRPPAVSIERSTDGGATWTPGGIVIFNGPAHPAVAAQGSLTGSPASTGTALYRLRFDGQAGVFPWSVYQ